MGSTQVSQKVTLYSREGGSDKQYTLWIEPAGVGFLVQSQYGPRGGWVQAVCKTPQPVPLSKAEVVYQRILKEKKSKGYHEGEDAPAFSQVEGATDSGLRPMLLTDATDEGPEKYIADPVWGAQEKINGKRIMLRAVGGKVVGVNRRGLECPIPKELQEAFKNEAFVLDGELVGTVYHVFDCLEDGANDLRQSDTTFRSQMAEKLVDGAGSNVKFVPMFFGEWEKRKLVEKLREGRREGVVFKKLRAPYEPGRREALSKAIAVKCKFYAAIAAVPLKWTKDKLSVELGLKDGSSLVSVGKVTIPEKYVTQVELGKPIRVKYLYATGGRQLYQPNLDPTADGSIRADQTSADPLTALKFEGKEQEE